jgi:hypothetical protein
METQGIMEGGNSQGSISGSTEGENGAKNAPMTPPKDPAKDRILALIADKWDALSQDSKNALQTVVNSIMNAAK